MDVAIVVFIREGERDFCFGNQLRLNIKISLDRGCHVGIQCVFGPQLDREQSLFFIGDSWEHEWRDFRAASWGSRCSNLAVSPLEDRSILECSTVFEEKNYVRKLAFLK